nr:unnamed protein product [Callosobruchus analis]
MSCEFLTDKEFEEIIPNDIEHEEVSAGLGDPDSDLSDAESKHTDHDTESDDDLSTEETSSSFSLQLYKIRETKNNTTTTRKELRVAQQNQPDASDLQLPTSKRMRCVLCPQSMIERIQ